ncbi:unnamed protein product, partial [Symbiodinium sp. KB8]
GASGESSWVILESLTPWRSYQALAGALQGGLGRFLLKDPGQSTEIDHHPWMVFAYRGIRGYLVLFMPICALCMTLVLFFGWILASWHKRIGKELEGAIAVAEPYGRIVAVLPSFGTASSDAIAAAGQGRLAPVFHVPVRSAHGAKAVFPPQHPCPRSDDAPLCEARLCFADRTKEMSSVDRGSVEGECVLSQRAARCCAIGDRRGAWSLPGQIGGDVRLCLCNPLHETSEIFQRPPQNAKAVFPPERSCHPRSDDAPLCEGLFFELELLDSPLPEPPREISSQLLAKVEPKRMLSYVSFHENQQVASQLLAKVEPEHVPAQQCPFPLRPRPGKAKAVRRLCPRWEDAPLCEAGQRRRGARKSLSTSKSSAAEFDASAPGLRNVLVNGEAATYHPASAGNFWYNPVKGYLQNDSHIGTRYRMRILDSWSRPALSPPHEHNDYTIFLKHAVFLERSLAAVMLLVFYITTGILVPKAWTWLQLPSAVSQNSIVGESLVIQGNHRLFETGPWTTTTVDYRDLVFVEYKHIFSVDYKNISSVDYKYSFSEEYKIDFIADLVTFGYKSNFLQRLGCLRDRSNGDLLGTHDGNTTS